MMTGEGASDSSTLIMTRIVSAPPERVFRAWTNPQELQCWWGPEGVRCVTAEIDLQVGGKFRIGNELPDKTILWITGRYLEIEVAKLLSYSWAVEGSSSLPERVTIRFKPHDEGTEILLKHEQIPSVATRNQHKSGWVGCFRGLAAHMIRTENEYNDGT